MTCKFAVAISMRTAILSTTPDLRQGDMVIAEITVKALGESIDNVAIVDMLPAAFEIENPRLQSRKGITWIGDRAYHPLYMDIRDDRMVLYGNFPLWQGTEVLLRHPRGVRGFVYRATGARRGDVRPDEGIGGLKR